MKTTIDLPDPISRKVKATAAERGISLKTFITEAVERNLAYPSRTGDESPGCARLIASRKFPNPFWLESRSGSQPIGCSRSRTGDALTPMLLDTNAVSAIAAKDPAIMVILGGAERVMLPYPAVAEFRLRAPRVTATGSGFLASGATFGEFGNRFPGFANTGTLCLGR